MTPWLRPAAHLAAAILSLSIGSVALAAHPLVEGGADLYEQGLFDEALEAFSRAEAADDLELADVLELLERRALVHHAMGNTEALEVDLRRLAQIDPSHRLSDGTPPDVREVFVRVRGALPGRLRLAVETEATAAGVSIRAEAVHGEGLVRAVRIHGRNPGAEWRSASDAPLLVPSADGALVEYYVEAIGPGGAVLTSSGTRAEPLQASAPRAAPPAASPVDEGGVSPWVVVGIIGGVALAAGIAVLLVVLLDDGLNDLTQPTHFMVEGFN